MKERERNGEADRRERINAALARYEAANHKRKRSKRKAVKLFSVDKYEPERERAINTAERGA